jgi:hypothetical protein
MVSYPYRRPSPVVPGRPASAATSAPRPSEMRTTDDRTDSPLGPSATMTESMASFAPQDQGGYSPETQGEVGSGPQGGGAGPEQQGAPEDTSAFDQAADRPPTKARTLPTNPPSKASSDSLVPSSASRDSKRVLINATLREWSGAYLRIHS